MMMNNQTKTSSDGKSRQCNCKVLVLVPMNEQMYVVVLVNKLGRVSQLQI